MVHIIEFVADLIKHGKLNLDPSRNDHIKLTFHDSCNPARAMGFFEEPRYVIKNICNHFYEMPENTIREADILLWRRSRTGDGREHGNATAGRASERKRGQVRTGKVRS